MTFTDSIFKHPPYNTDTEGDSDSSLVCSIIFKNNKYAVEGRKFGQESIYWDVIDLGFVITSNKSPIVFSNNELNTSEVVKTFTMWHSAGLSSIN